MNEPNPIQRAPGHHLGPVPADPALQAEIQRAQTAGFDTCSASHYAELEEEGVDIGWLRGIA